jgi:hypothetical protein
MSKEEKLIHDFYSAFAACDYQTMQTLYHENTTFSDPVFYDLNAEQVRGMWKMLLTSAKSLQIEFKNIRQKEDKFTCEWEAKYIFSGTGRHVHNKVVSSFVIFEDKIVWQKDEFDLWRWSRQAFGLSGLLLGWTPFMRDKIQRTAYNRLQKFLAKGSVNFS